MAGWHHGLDERESEWTLGVDDGQGGPVCCNSWGRKELDMTERLDWLTDWVMRCLSSSLHVVGSTLVSMCGSSLIVMGESSQCVSGDFVFLLSCGEASTLWLWQGCTSLILPGSSPGVSRVIWSGDGISYWFREREGKNVVDKKIQERKRLIFLGLHRKLIKS